jgi:hypothetical protein
LYVRFVCTTNKFSKKFFALAKSFFFFSFLDTEKKIVSASCCLLRVIDKKDQNNAMICSCKKYHATSYILLLLLPRPLKMFMRRSCNVLHPFINQGCTCAKQYTIWVGCSQSLGQTVSARKKVNVSSCPIRVMAQKGSEKPEVALIKCLSFSSAFLSSKTNAPTMFRAPYLCRLCYACTSIP